MRNGSKFQTRLNLRCLGEIKTPTGTGNMGTENMGQKKKGKHGQQSGLDPSTWEFIILYTEMAKFSQKGAQEENYVKVDKKKRKYTKQLTWSV